jgi:hypothetical protein
MNDLVIGVELQGEERGGEGKKGGRRPDDYTLK